MKVVLFGAGYWGVNYIKELGARLECVIEPDAKRALHIKKVYNVDVFPELPQDVTFDGAIIATPPHTHVEIAAPLLDKGYYTLIEKPMSDRLHMLDSLHNVDRCMSGLVYLYHPSVLNLRSLFLAGELFAHAYSRRTNNGPIRTWGDALWDLAPHDISIFNYIFGTTPEEVSVNRHKHWAMLRMLYHPLNLESFETFTYVSWLGGPKTRKVEFLGEGSERIIFDEMVEGPQDPSPLRLMLDDFLSGEWSQRSSFRAGKDVVKVLELAEGAILK